METQISSDLNICTLYLCVSTACCRKNSKLVIFMQWIAFFVNDFWIFKAQLCRIVVKKQQLYRKIQLLLTSEMEVCDWSCWLYSCSYLRSKFEASDLTSLNECWISCKIKKILVFFKSNLFSTTVLAGRLSAQMFAWNSSTVDAAHQKTSLVPKRNAIRSAGIKRETMTIMKQMTVMPISFKCSLWQLGELYLL